MEERSAAANERLVCHTEFIVVSWRCYLCDCVSELKEENMDLQDIVLGLYELLQKAREGPCRWCSGSHERTAAATRHSAVTRPSGGNMDGSVTEVCV